MIIIQTRWDVGWTEAQELNAKGWRIQLSSQKDGRTVFKKAKPNMDPLEFNALVQEFMRVYPGARFMAFKDEHKEGRGT